MHSVSDLARWAAGYRPDEADLRLAVRSLHDTLAVAATARAHQHAALSRELDQAGRLAVLAHLIDYDDLHVPSTTHISAICVPVALAMRGDERSYLAGAGVMARLGMLLSWSHYDAGWHATCTAGAPAAAATAAVAMGLDANGVATAMTLAVPAAGGVRAAFGTSSKSLQVGFAADAGVRGARLAAAGADADPAAFDQWLSLVGGTGSEVPQAPAIPGGLAIKRWPCCYALQRPVAAVLTALGGRRLTSDEVESIVVRVSEDALRPLVHHRPRTGLEGKFSLEYACAAAALDGSPEQWSWTDDAVARPEAQEVLRRVTAETTPGGEGLLAGDVTALVRLRGGGVLTATVAVPPGAPDRPLTEAELGTKVRACAGETDGEQILAADWSSAPALVEALFTEIEASA